MARIFLARTEEQKRFREVLRSLQPNAGWFSKNLPTVSIAVAKLLPAKKEAVSTSPHIFLLYGEGGMGKTSLGRRFCDLARDEFPNCFEVLRLDWEEAKNEDPTLNVGHESIRPESVLATIYLAVSKGREGIFEKYRQVEKTLKQIEEKVDKELQARQGEGAEYAPILKKGLSWSLGALRKLPQVEVLLGAGDGKVDEAIADGAVSALVGLMKKRLSLEERRIFATPQRQLAEALGDGLQAISTQKPLVLLLDTYEIVDRLECDRVLQMVIKAAGRRVVWVIAGRANLADTYRLLDDTFLGYKNEFSDTLYAYPMSEFSQKQVIEYFAHPDINVLLNDKEAESVKQFSLGIPYVVQLIAEMCNEGIDLATILGASSDDRENESPSEKVIRMTSDRFLRYCIRGSADEKAIYAMAMMRRSDNELLKAMLGVFDLESKMRSLKERYSFVLLEGKCIKLHNNLKGFLQDHLRSGLPGQSRMVKGLSKRAIDYLEPRLSEWIQEFTDTADYFESDRIANGLLDLVQFKFWQDVEVGWRYAVPLFVESWQYNLNWQKQLLEVIETFQVRFDGDSIKRLQIFTKVLSYFSFDPDSRKELLDELEKLAKRGWLDGNYKNECTVILAIQRGQIPYEKEDYREAFRIYSQTVSYLEKTPSKLQENLAKKFENIGDKLGWQNRYGKEAYEYCVKFNPKCSKALDALGSFYYHEKKYELAVDFHKKAVEFDDSKADIHYNLGYAYEALGKCDLAIKSYKQSIQIDDKYLESHIRLGSIYKEKKQYDLAIEPWKKAVEISSQNAYLCYSLGSIYQEIKQYELAISHLKKAIEINPQNAYYHYSLGLIQNESKQYKLAIICLEKAVEIEPKNPTYSIALAYIYKHQKKYRSAVKLFKKIEKIDPKIDRSKFYSGINLLCSTFEICEENE